jgi:hypothetical protein
MDIINVQYFLSAFKLKNGFSDWLSGIYFSNIPFYLSQYDRGNATIEQNNCNPLN